MEYRIHPKTGDKISVIGIGTGPIFDTTEKEAVQALVYAYEHGANYLDFGRSCSTRSILAPTMRLASMAGPRIWTR